MTEEKKFGIVSCSGEDFPEGTISRIATRIVMDELKPGTTTTICLPLFLTGGGNERLFARKHPTITVDGCEKRCAARATGKYSGKPIASIVVSEIPKKELDTMNISRDNLGPSGMEIAKKVACEIADTINTFTDQE